MLPLHGLQVSIANYEFSSLKQKLLLFDKIFLPSLNPRENWTLSADGPDPEEVQSAINLLADAGVLGNYSIMGPSWDGADITDDMYRDIDMYVRWCAARVAYHERAEIVPILRGQLSDRHPEAPSFGFEGNVLRVGLEQLPLPDDSSPFEDVIDFKIEAQDKQWAFRRFLHTLSTKPQSEAEIRDDFEWCLDEYAKTMRLHHLKSTQGFVEVYLIPAVEILEDIAKLNWSKIGRNILSVKKRKVELLEAELKAPGRECAYVFEARKRFSR
jgi:hypothetical protein